MNEHDVIVPAVQVPYSPAKSAKKSGGQLAVTILSAIGVGLMALFSEPAFVDKVVELAGDNKSWLVAFAAIRLLSGFFLDKRKHKNGGVVELKDGE